ncbi:hypothetical protein C2W62_44355 [Candidatus Entotheonella serta]|nr:hypothetical protein C2W62_44355 [Candidatus Entotheonella serta]
MVDIHLIDQRLSQLKQEYETGQRQISELQTRIKELKEMLLRISGAIQILEELRDGDADEPSSVTG